MKTIKYLLITCTITLYTSFCFSQVTGKCIDTLGNPIPYINVSVKLSASGTVTDENGIFHLNENLQNEIDSLIISHISYITQTISSNRKDSILVV